MQPATRSPWLLGLALCALLVVVGLRQVERQSSELQGHAVSSTIFELTATPTGDYEVTVFGRRFGLGQPARWHRPVVNFLREGWQGLYLYVQSGLSRVLPTTSLPYPQL